MNRMFGLSGVKSLDKLKSSSPVSTKVPSASYLCSPDSVPSGSIANLKLTAEKLVKEQASTVSELEMANSKLKRLTEQICMLEEKFQTEQIRMMEEKLQNAFNENAKLKVKLKEDEKLWKGLESKFYSIKIPCDQITDTLQQLTIQVQDAEKDKAFFEDKLTAASVAMENLDEHMTSMSLRLDSSEETVKTREKELMELGLAKERMETSYRIEEKRAATLIEEKDGTIKQLEEDVAANRISLESLTSNIVNLHIEMKVKEDNLLELRNSKEILERENLDLFSSKNDFAKGLETALKEIKSLEDFVNMLVVKLTDMEKQNLTYSEKVIQLNTSFDSCFKLAQQEKDLAAQCAQQKIDKIRHQCISVTSEKNSLQLSNQELNNKVLDLQKEQEFTMVQHAEECRIAEEKIRKMASEAEILLSKQSEMQVSITGLEDKVKTLLENSKLSDKEKQDLLLKLSELETESKGLIAGLKADILKNQGEIDLLRKEIEKSEEIKESLEKRVSELDNAIAERERIVLELKTKENQFEDQKAEIMEALADKESKLEEAKKQYDQMLESKQLELSKHLKEISQRNDQAINDIRRKYETEKQESVNLEKEKADKAIQDMEKQYVEKITEYKEQSQQNLVRVQEEHASMISRIQQEHDKKEIALMTKHNEETKHAQIQAESELREKSISLRSEHEAQLRALRCEHEDECRRMQEELDAQRAKEERQKALLELQLKVMSDKPQEDQEVNSKKRSRMRNPGNGNRNQRALHRKEVEEKDSPYLNATPVSKMLKNVENVYTGGALKPPKHRRQVTHHEYDTETSNGRTITKRRKTKNTVMFGDSTKQRKRETPKAKTPKEVFQGVKDRGPPNPSNIGDLFTEGSLNPYADDPYAFD